MQQPFTIGIDIDVSPPCYYTDLWTVMDQDELDAFCLKHSVHSIYLQQDPNQDQTMLELSNAPPCIESRFYSTKLTNVYSALTDYSLGVDLQTSDSREEAFKELEEITK